MATIRIAVLLLLALVGRAAAGPRIVNGLFTSEYPSTGALLLGADAASGSTECSGTLIGCETFVTAAHCVCDTVGSECQPGGPHAPDPTGMWVFLQHAGIFAVSSVTVRSDYDFPNGDVALLHLASPVTGVRPTPLDRTRTPGVGGQGTIVGFGSSGGQDYGLKRVGQITTAPCTPADPVNAVLTCWDFESPLGPPGTDSDTCFADSGGPLFVDFGCGPTLAGITSGGTASVCAPTDHAFDADVFTYRSYIDAAGGPDVGAPSCGAMPQAGDPGTEITGFQGTVSAAGPDATHLVTVPAGTTQLRVALNAFDDGVANFDLFVRFGAPPTPTTFDCAGQGPGQFAVCDLAAPAAGTWYVLVRRVTGGGTYQVTATTFAIGSPAGGNDGQPCDDRRDCTGGDVCGGGNCAGVPVADGSPCDDGSACTQSDACSAGACAGVATPAVACRLPVVGGKASLAIRNDPADRHDQLVWKWLKGAATAPGDFGDPTASTAYEMCVFDTHAAVPSLVVDAHVPPGPAWKPIAGGFRFRDRSGTVAGIGSILLKSGADARASIALKAKGAGFVAPALPLASDPRVVVQLLNGAACWEARYPTSVLDTATQFKARAE